MGKKNKNYQMDSQSKSNSAFPERIDPPFDHSQKDIQISDQGKDQLSSQKSGYFPSGRKTMTLNCQIQPQLSLNVGTAQIECEKNSSLPQFSIHGFRSLRRKYSHKKNSMMMGKTTKKKLRQKKKIKKSILPPIIEESQSSSFSPSGQDYLQENYEFSTPLNDFIQYLHYVLREDEPRNPQLLKLISFINDRFKTEITYKKVFEELRQLSLVYFSMEKMEQYFSDDVEDINQGAISKFIRMYFISFLRRNAVCHILTVPLPDKSIKLKQLQQFRKSIIVSQWENPFQRTKKF